MTMLNATYFETVTQKVRITVDIDDEDFIAELEAVGVSREELPQAIAEGGNEGLRDLLYMYGDPAGEPAIWQVQYREDTGDWKCSFE